MLAYNLSKKDRKESKEMITLNVNYETALHVLLYYLAVTSGLSTVWGHNHDGVVYRGTTMYVDTIDSMYLAYYSQKYLQKSKTKKYLTILRIILYH
jgi:hypothetical protein